MATNTSSPLPSLDGFTRDELCELVRVLHGALTRSHAAYESLHADTQKVVAIAEAMVDTVTA